jgi:hypothetical protein
MKVYKIAGSTKLYQVFPVGAVYISVVNTNPHYLFGGTWTQITDRFLYCTTTSKTTGGSVNHRHGLPFISEASNTGNTRYMAWNSWGDVGDRITFANRIPVNVAEGSSYTGYQVMSAYSDNMPPYFTVYAWYRTA